MAQCACGGEVTAARNVNKKLMLEYGKCKGCGRIGMEQLSHRTTGEILAVGQQAKALYLAAEAGEPEPVDQAEAPQLDFI